jgi:hypothetical protein
MSVSAKRKSREFRALLSVAGRHKSGQAVEEEITGCTMHWIRPCEKGNFFLLSAMIRRSPAYSQKKNSDQAVQTARCKQRLRAKNLDLIMTWGIFFYFFDEQVRNPISLE